MIQTKSQSETNTLSIYNFIDMIGIKLYLLNHPHLLIILEFLIIHIDDYIKLSNLNKSNIAKSSHI